jgi:hypothetical protein
MTLGVRLRRASTIVRTAKIKNTSIVSRPRDVKPPGAAGG